MGNDLHAVLQTKTVAGSRTFWTDISIWRGGGAEGGQTSHRRPHGGEQGLEAAPLSNTELSAR